MTRNVKYLKDYKLQVEMTHRMQNILYKIKLMHAYKLK